ncbi:Mismatch repair protein msh3 [Serendipita sp. 399]|nr:Mismatch repair protein msh3 [Serendipita sp. 399]
MPATSRGTTESGKTGSQTTLSHFFQPKRSTSTSVSNPTIPQKRMRSSSPAIDLTVESDEDGEAVIEHPPKRAKHVATRPTARSAEEPTELNRADKTVESPMKKKFKYIVDDGSSPLPIRDKGSKDETLRRKFKETLKQVLQTDSGFSSQLDDMSEKNDEDFDIAEEKDDDEDDEDQAVSKLHERFSSGVSLKGTTKAKSTGTSKGKKKQEIGPSGQAYTPLELQVKKLKEENEGTLLLFEVGYKYRFFGEDARIASKALGIACFMNRNFLTASIPVHRKMIHTKKLLSLGHRVGIVGQTETAALKKVGENKSGPFTRQVTELYTATTFVDEMESLDNDEMSYRSTAALMCLSEGMMGGMGSDERVNIGLVSVSPATGEVVYDEFLDTGMRTELETRLAHIKPCELLLPGKKLSPHTEKMLRHYSDSGGVRIERVQDELDYTEAFEVLQDFYQSSDGDPEFASSTIKENRPFADIVDFPKQVVVALAHAIRHLVAYGLSNAFRKIAFFAKFLTRSHMLLNANTLENLEIFQNQTDYTRKGSLLSVLDHTMTKFGSRQLRQWIGKPLVNRQVLDERLQAVEEIIAEGSAALVKLRTLLKGLPDLVKGLCRIQYGKARSKNILLNLSDRTQSNPKELVTVLSALSRISTEFEPMDKPEDAGLKSPLLNDIVFALPRLRAIVSRFLADIDIKKAREGEITKLWKDPGKYPEIEDAQQAIVSVDLQMQEHLKEVRKAIRRPGLNWVSVAGVDYLVEVPNSEKGKVPEDWNRVQGTKKVTRFHTPDARRSIALRDQHRETLQTVSMQAFHKFQQEINGEYGFLRDAINKLGIADALISIAQASTSPGYSKPIIVEDDELEINNGRHPMIEVLSASPFVPNSVKLGGSHSLAIVLTGPNMGGKSSFTRSVMYILSTKRLVVTKDRLVALLVIMSQIGCYVPATEAKIPLHDAVLTRMGASDEISRGKSTFMVELSETSEILQAATEKSLVILDELGRGTATWDGVAIASSVLNYIVTKVKCKTLFITHYPRIGVELSQQYPEQVSSAHMAYMEEEDSDGRREIHFLYTLKDGIAERSFGVECGRLAGLPQKVLDKAAVAARTLEERERRLQIRSLLKEVKRTTSSQRELGLDTLIQKCGAAASNSISHIQ